MTDSQRVSPDGSSARTDARTLVSRRGAIALGGSMALGSVAGCLGQTGDSAAKTESPEPPWTTEALGEFVDDDATITIYSANGDAPTWESLVDVVNDEFGTSLELNVFNAHAGAVSQRIIQERQAGKDKADVISTANDITARIREDGRQVAEKWYETDLDERFWFSTELPDEFVYPWMVKALNGGAWSVMPLNEELFDERGLDVPTSYNDLFEDQYAGLKVAIPGYIVTNQVGWIMGYHAEKMDMTPQEWMRTLMDHLEFTGVESHSTGARSVAQGDVPMMFYNFPSTISPLMHEDYPLYANFVDPVKASAWKTELCINREAPHPWVARFFVSAVLEESVQRRIVHEVPQVAPGRMDLDYAAEDPDSYMSKRLDADTVVTTFSEGSEYIELGQRAKKNDVFEY